MLKNGLSEEVWRGGECTARMVGRKRCKEAVEE